MAVLTASAVVSAPSSRRTSWLGGAAAIASLALLAVELHDVPFGELFAHVQVHWLLAAVFGTALSLAAAAHNLSAFAPLRLRVADTLRAQLAICGLRVIAPSAVSTPAIGARYLARSGLGTTEALAVVGTAQAAQLIMTILVVGVIAAMSASDLPAPDPRTGLIVICSVAVVIVVAVVVGRRVPAVRRAVQALRNAACLIGTHLRRHPMRVLTGLGASAGLTIAHVATFACSVHAVGGHASVLTLTAVYLGAASAGSLVPTPAGVGAVESAMIAGLVAGGVPTVQATAAALMTRLITVWALAIPGWWAMRSLRRDGLL